MKKTIVAFMSYILFVVPLSSFADTGHMKDHAGGVEATKQAEIRHKNGFTQELREGGVTTRVIYENPRENKPPVFKVELDSHDIDFDRYEFDKILVLRDDKGRIFSPEVTSSSGSGQHRKATVEFKGADISSARFIELVVKDVAGVAERVFRFDVKK